LRAGAAIVATDVGGTREVTGDGALLVPGGNAVALASAIDALLADPAARARWGNKALAQAARLPDDDAARDAVVDVYRYLLGRGHLTE